MQGILYLRELRYQSKRNAVHLELKHLVQSNGDNFGALASVGVDKRNLVEESLGVVLVEAEEAKVFPGGRARDQEKLLGSVAEGVNGNSL